VDDGSTDDTAAMARNAGAHVIQHLKNQGYGSSLKTGILAAQHDTIIITDADGTYPCAAIPRLLEALADADLVIGARVSENVHIPMVRKPGKWMLARLAEYISGEKIPDLNSGLRAFRRTTLLPYFNILSDKFSFTTTQTLAMLCNNYKVLNITIDYYPRKGKSKIVAWDFVNFVSLVLRLSMLFNPLKVFVPVSMTCILLSFVKFVLDLLFAIQRAGGLSWHILAQPTVSTTTLILFLAGIQILLVGMVSDGLSRKIEQYQPDVLKRSHALRDLGRAATDPESTES
jgi:glycosyltransferase involved in cell wall biosynthesis